MNTHGFDFAEVKAVVSQLKDALSTVENDKPGGTPKPCLMPRLQYGHAIVDQLEDQMAALGKMGFSLARVSNR
jgi:hypothetical protein